MALSPKQIAMAWINSKLEPDKINPENDELMAIAGNSLSSEKMDKAREFIMADLAKVKVRYQQYTEKYVGEVNVNNSPENEEDEAPEERDTSGDLPS